MTRTTTPLAVAADYADALMTARRAKNWLFILILLMLISQVTVFILAKTNILKLESAVLTSTSQPVEAKPAVDVDQIVRYATPIINFASVGLTIVLVIVMLLLVTIMLVGRLIGVSHVTSAFIWGVLFLIVLFPWQTFLIADDHYPVSASASSSISEQPAFKWPGALYTYAELKRDYRFENSPIQVAVWGWGRYVGWPMLAILLLLVVQAKSSRGLRYALGEADLHVEISSRADATLVQ